MWQAPGKPINPQQFHVLQPLKVLYDFDGPKIFTFRDRDGELCFAHWCEEDNDVTRNIALAFSERLLTKLEQGAISVRDALEQPRAWVLDEDGQGNIRASWRVDIADLPEEVLPKPGAMLSPSFERTHAAELTPKSA